MSLKTLQEEKQKGFPEQVYVIRYEDPFFEKHIISVIRDDVFSLDVYDTLDTEQPLSIQNIADSLCVMPMFSSKAMVAIRNVQKLKVKELETLNRYVSKPADGAALFLFYAVPRGSSKKEDTIKLAGKFRLIDLTLSGKYALNDWIVSECDKRGIVLETKAAEFLKEMYGDDLQLFSNELEKLSLLGSKKITLSDTYETCFGSHDFNIFAFVGMITRGDTSGALSMIKGMKDAFDDKFHGAVNYGLSKGNTPLEAFKTHLMLHIKMRLNADFPYELFVAELSKSCKTDRTQARLPVMGNRPHY
ncbi:DNA polymerase III subunit delta [Candidatus Magnetomonas plexicatena]|uniref:DNA polymerase III subunit delta n=1 Tax=Candidatus Magnetomonas plexicatena TaxID=2552947 RepID=UPI001C740EFA|nr:hypothetical protein E2O03_006725 [Nitrospirales bacterium LBB_01]